MTLDTIEEPKTVKLPSVFMVSSGRSGTTLLASMLNATDQIYIPYESDFIARAYPAFGNRTDLNNSDYAHIARMFRRAAKESGWGMPVEEVEAHLETKQPRTFAQVNAAIYQLFHQREKTEDLKWGIKAPVLIASLDRIHRTCPQAKIVHVVRDGRDVYLSYKRVHDTSAIKFGPKSVVENALYWVDGLRRVAEFTQSCPDCTVYELTYNDILESPTSTLQQLCDFLEIEYKPSMHENFNDFERNKKVAPKVFRESIHKKLHSGLDSKNTQKYLTAMTPWQLFQFELIAAPYLQKYGYSLKYQWLGWKLFSPVRWGAHFLARQFNDWRYAKRDREVFNKELQP